ncbi:MAG: TRAP transporter permease [Candidatus Fonsibacter ubiquis]|jgi:TRAP transporter 4TM/12TM fusion protein|uniref:TRAP transporter permease n=1 Tax=Candidatus Fonsibacter ubiquis TaxID=1925548 RepID=UPI000C08CA8B|nr:TRAP transporter permease [Candidatus Fonsibacter ubiquis]
MDKKINSTGNNLSVELIDPLIEKFPLNLEGKILFYIAIAFSSFQLLTAAHIIDVPSQILRSVHVGFLGLLGFPLVLAIKKKNIFFKIIGWCIALVSVAVATYQIIEYKPLILRSGDPIPMDIVFGVLALVVVFGVSWVIMGIALPIICGVFLLYCLFGNNLSGLFQHRGYDFKTVIEHMTYGTEGIYGVPTYVSSTFIFLFILFGSFLERAGMIKLFTDVSLGTVGHTTGGPAKVSIVSSGLMGTISGSGVANVVTTGQFTIPLMKKFGYRSAFAGGVEATASMGGQIMPPVMGAVAFIMAETLGVEYFEIVKAAIIPALLYYFSAFWMVHLEASKRNLIGLPKNELPSAIKAIKEKWFLVLPLLVLIYLLFAGYTPLYSGSIGLILTAFLILGSSIALGFSSKIIKIIFWIILGFTASLFFKLGADVIKIILVILLLWNFFSKGGRETLLSCRDALAEGAKTALPVGVACAVVGIIIGTLTLTGIASSIAGLVIDVGKTSIFLSLVLTMFISLILGMGIPTIPNYIITSAVVAPALLKLGVPLIVSHMFVFYFGIMADLTPPVALACFAAAPIAKESGLKISFEAIKVAMAGFVIPYMAVYSPELMLQGYDGNNLLNYIFSVFYICIKVILAILFWGITVIGYYHKDLNFFERFVTFLVPFLLVITLPLTDQIAFFLIAVILIYCWFNKKKINT